MEGEGMVAIHSRCCNQQWAKEETFMTRPLQATRMELEGEVLEMDQQGLQVRNNALK